MNRSDPLFVFSGAPEKERFGVRPQGEFAEIVGIIVSVSFHKLLQLLGLDSAAEANNPALLELKDDWLAQWSHPGLKNI